MISVGGDWAQRFCAGSNGHRGRQGHSVACVGRAVNNRFDLLFRRCLNIQAALIVRGRAAEIFLSLWLRDNKTILSGKRQQQIKACPTGGQARLGRTPDRGAGRDHLPWSNVWSFAQWPLHWLADVAFCRVGRLSTKCLGHGHRLSYDTKNLRFLRKFALWNPVFDDQKPVFVGHSKRVPKRQKMRKKLRSAAFQTLFL